MKNTDNLLPEQLERQMEAAQMVAETMRVLQKSNTNIIGEIISTSTSDADTYYEWEHLPPGDAYDLESHSQYYYHSHAKSEDGSSIHDDEHGHFHTFMRAKGYPEGIEPVALPDYEPVEDLSDIVTHVIGVGMNEMGVPIRLFTVNRWVTGEIWHAAEDIIKMLDSFEIDDTRPSWPMNLWISNLVALYRPQIEVLIRQRDEAIAKWQAEHPDVENVYEDRNLEVTSHLDINLAEYVTNLEESLQEAA